MVHTSYSRLKLCVVKFCIDGKTDGRKLLESEQMDCRGAGLASMASVVPLASMASMAPMASMATTVLVALAALMVPNLTVKILKTCLQLTVTPRGTECSRRLRWVDKITGKRVEGLPCKN